MSRSHRASTGGSAPVSAALRGIGEQWRFGASSRLDQLLGASSPLTRLLWVATVTVTVLAVLPRPAMAEPGAGRQAARPAQVSNKSHGPHGKAAGGTVRRVTAARARMRAPRARQSVAVLLAVGSGYDRPHGSPLVRDLQRQLARAGFAPGPVDGLYGPNTERAVRSFQADRGLPMDGVAGPSTREALTARTPTLYPGAGYGAAGGSRLVRDLQRHLRRAGYVAGPDDGLYGPRTANAVREFQARHGLSADGIARPQTLTRLSKPTSAGKPRTPSKPTTPGKPATPSKPTTPQPHAGRNPHRTRSRPGAPYRAPGTPLGLGNRPGTNHPSPWRSLALTIVLATLLLVLLLLAAAGIDRRRQGRVPATPTEPEVSEGQSAPGGDTVPTASEAPAVPAAAQKRSLELRNGQMVRTPTPPANESPKPDESADPNDLFNLAVLLEEQGDPEQAAAAYRRADELGHAAAASNLGVLLERKGDLAGAEAAYRRADQRGDANGAFNLAVLLEERRELDAAEAAYQRANHRGPAPVANSARAALLELRKGNGMQGGSGGDHRAA